MSTPHTSPGPEALYLDTGDGQAFALFHPARGPQRRRAVLLCPPFGWDDMCSYRSRRDLAERLAGEGYAALRLDLPGSGDSPGGPRDPDRLAAWTDAVGDAARWLRETCDAELIVAFAIGLGGLIAYRAASHGAAIDELALWDVPARGRTLMRAMRAFSALEVAYIPDPDTPVPAPDSRTEDGAIVVNGYLLSAATAAEISRLDVAELGFEGNAPSRALLLGREELKVDQRLREALERASVAVEIAAGVGYGAMMIEPQFSRPPVAVFELVSSWLAQGETHTAASPAHEPAPGAVAVRRQLELECDGGELRETPLWIQGPTGPLFAILAEPCGNRAPGAQLCALLVNAGPQRRVGPSRMWVEVARRWAARGVPTLRIDLAGIGDSDGDAASLVRVAALYEHSFVDEARAALDALVARGLPERFLVMGLCAGAYWSTHLTLEDERVRTLVMLNPRTMIWDAWVYGTRRTRELRRQILMASTWRKALRGELTLARHLETALALASRATRTPSRMRERLAAPPDERSSRDDDVLAMFDRLSDRDQRVLMLFAGSEPLRRDLTALGFFEHLDRWPNMRVEIRGTAADTHTLTPLWLQHEVHQLVDEALEGELLRRAG
jgi:alpha-beta hydrolase superfamily lysophospholipase